MNDETLKKAWAAFSAKGGKANSEAQTAARRKNAAKARKARKIAKAIKVNVADKTTKANGRKKQGKG